MKKLNTEDAMKVEFGILRPFGPRVGKVQCPPSVVELMLEITDSIVADDNHESSGKNLVGQIVSEPHISREILLETGAFKFFNGMLYHYLYNVLNELKGYFVHQANKLEDEFLLETNVKDMWSVHMKPGGEYNPLHFHTFCHVSSVMYLKIPEYQKRGVAHKAETDGNIELVNHASGPESLDNGTMSISPKVGEMFMWPSNLLHTVYPFLGDEERRSVAWNGTYKLTNKENGHVIMGDRTIEVPVIPGM